MVSRQADAGGGACLGKGTTVVFREEDKELVKQNLDAIRFITQRAQKASESAILMTTKDAKDIYRLAGEVLSLIE